MKIPRATTKDLTQPIIIIIIIIFLKKRENIGDLLGGPVVKTPGFHCRGRGFDLWSGN